MYILFKLIIILFLFNNIKTINAISPNLCEQSWECGNPPYTICANKINLMKGIAVDEVNNKVLLIGKFNSSGISYGNVSIASISMNGGIIKDEYSIKSDVKAGSGFRTTFQLFKYLPKSKILMTQASERLSTVIGIYSNSNNNHDSMLAPLWYPRGYSLAVYFDETNQLTYSCDFNVNVYPKIIKSQDDLYGSGSAGMAILSQSRQCVGISNKFKNSNFGSDNVIFASIEDSSRTNFYIGSANCPSCKRNFTSFYNYSGIVNDMFIYNNLVYFSTPDSGIISIDPINPLSTPPNYITKDPTDSIYFVESQKTIYYISNNIVKKVDINKKQSLILYNPNNSKNIGTCMCADGFSGILCNQCNGFVMWENGNPTCVSMQYNGFPSQCSADWQCNTPYGFCNGGLCSCREGFSGEKCSKCEGGKINWDNGIPTCVYQGLQVQLTF